MIDLRRWLLISVGLALVVGCGDEPTKKPTPSPSPPPPAIREPRVEVVSAADKARYALDRLMTGPKPTAGLRVSDLHRKNLALAQQDLAAIPAETLRMLDDEALIERLTTAHPSNQDPWHNVLAVLGAVQGKPPALVRRWAEPALKSPHATLRRQAIRAIASEPDGELAAVALAFLKRDPHDRELAYLALRTLFRLDDQWRNRAMEVIFRLGSPLMWTRVVDALEAATPPEARAARMTMPLFWWQALTEGSGPRLPAMLPRVKEFPWTARRAFADPGMRVGSNLQVVPPVPESHGGWFGKPLGAQGVLPSLALAMTGRTPAADARCALARMGVPAFVVSVVADRALAASHPLHLKALHCMLPGDEMEGRQNVMARLTEQLRAIVEDGAPVEPQTLGRLVDGLPDPAGNKHSRELLERIVRALPDHPASRLVLEKASDRLSLLGPDWIAFFSELLQSDDAKLSGRALHVIFRANDPRFVDALEARMAQLPKAEQDALYRRLVFLYASGRVAPARTERFVIDLAKRLDAAPESAVRGLASALLDFGETGGEAFARGLSGPRRRLYLQAWPPGPRQVPLVVARAAVAPLDAKSAPGEVAAVLNLAYHTFPESSAPTLTALKQRLSGEPRKWLEPVLERVRHRAHR